MSQYYIIIWLHTSLPGEDLLATHQDCVLTEGGSDVHLVADILDCVGMERNKKGMTVYKA